MAGDHQRRAGPQPCERIFSCLPLVGDRLGRRARLAETAGATEHRRSADPLCPPGVSSLYGRPCDRVWTKFRPRVVPVGRPSGRAVALSWTAMFDQLSERLQGVLSDVRSRGKLSEDDVNKALREVRLALLEADVNFKVVKDFTASLQERLAGEEISEALNPGQTVIKAVNDELTELMGGCGPRPRLRPERPDRDPDGRPAGLGQDDGLREARQAARQAEQGRRPGRLRPAAARCGRAAREARSPGEGPRLLAAGRDRRRQGGALGARAGCAGEPRRR